MDEEEAQTGSSRVRGRVCKVCETKLYIKDFHKKLDRKILTLDKEIRHEKNETKNLQDKKTLMRRQIQTIKNEIDEQHEQFEEEMNLKRDDTAELDSYIKIQSEQNQKVADKLKGKSQYKRTK